MIHAVLMKWDKYLDMNNVSRFCESSNDRHGHLVYETENDREWKNVVTIILC